MPTMKSFSSFWRFLTTVTALVVAVGVFGDGPSAQQAARARRDGNFDIRSDSKSAGGRYLTRVAADPSIGASLADARAAGIARLKADHNTIDLENNPHRDARDCGCDPGTGVLTGRADRVGAMRGFLSTYADVYGLSRRRRTAWSWWRAMPIRPGTWRGWSSSSGSTACRCSRR